MKNVQKTDLQWFKERVNQRLTEIGKPRSLDVLKAFIGLDSKNPKIEKTKQALTKIKNLKDKENMLLFLKEALLYANDLEKESSSANKEAIEYLRNKTIDEFDKFFPDMYISYACSASKLHLETLSWKTSERELVQKAFDDYRKLKNEESKEISDWLEKQKPALPVQESPKFDESEFKKKFPKVYSFELNEAIEKNHVLNAYYEAKMEVKTAKKLLRDMDRSNEAYLVAEEDLKKKQQVLAETENPKLTWLETFIDVHFVNTQAEERKLVETAEKDYSKNKKPTEINSLDKHNVIWGKIYNDPALNRYFSYKQPLEKAERNKKIVASIGEFYAQQEGISYSPYDSYNAASSFAEYQKKYAKEYKAIEPERVWIDLLIQEKVAEAYEAFKKCETANELQEIGITFVSAPPVDEEIQDYSLPLPSAPPMDEQSEIEQEIITSYSTVASVLQQETLPAPQAEIVPAKAIKAEISADEKKDQESSQLLNFPTVPQEDPSWDQNEKWEESKKPELQLAV